MFRQPRRITFERYFRWASGLIPSSTIPLHSARLITSNPRAPPRLISSIAPRISCFYRHIAWNRLICTSDERASSRYLLLTVALALTRFSIEVILSQPSRYSSRRKKGFAWSLISVSVLLVTCGQNLRDRICKCSESFKSLRRPRSARWIA